MAVSNSSAIECPSLSRFDGLRFVDDVIPDTSNRSVGTVVRLKCPPRFDLVGSATLVCNSGGSWNTTVPPLCVPKGRRPTPSTDSKRTSLVTAQQFYGTSTMLDTNSVRYIQPSNTDVTVAAALVIAVFLALVFFIAIIYRHLRRRKSPAHIDRISTSTGDASAGRQEGPDNITRQPSLSLGMSANMGSRSIGSKGHNNRIWRTSHSDEQHGPFHLMPDIEPTPIEHISENV